MRSAASHIRRSIRSGRGAWLAVVAGALQACAFSTVDEDGARQIFGPALLAEVPVEGDDSTIASAVELRSFGLTVHDLGDGAAIALGYAMLRTGGLRDARDETRPPTAGAVPEPPARRRLVFHAVLPPVPGTVGRIREIEVAGVSALSLGRSRTVAVGYRHERLVVLGADVQVAGNPMSALDRLFARTDRAGQGGGSGK